MRESKSRALPLGYIPIFLFPVQYIISTASLSSVLLKANNNFSLLTARKRAIYDIKSQISASNALNACFSVFNSASITAYIITGGKRKNGKNNK